MKPNIHVETPDGEVLNTKIGNGTEGNEETGKSETVDPKDLVAGPKPNPDPFANSNLESKQKDKGAEGAGTEVTDGEAG